VYRGAGAKDWIDWTEARRIMIAWKGYKVMRVVADPHSVEKNGVDLQAVAVAEGEDAETSEEEKE
jgi:hypothetical protein